MTEALRLWHEYGDDEDGRFRGRLSDSRELYCVRPEQPTRAADGTSHQHAELGDHCTDHWHDPLKQPHVALADDDG